MKKKYHLFLFVLLFACCKNSFSQQPFLTVHYSYSEKSKSSSSTTEKISFTGSTAVYSVQYTGRKVAGQKNGGKECTLSSEQLSSIRKTIADKRLDITDSLVYDPSANEPYRVTISIVFTNGNKTSKTRVTGTPSEVGDKLLYKNSVSLLNLIRKILRDCGAIH